MALQVFAEPTLVRVSLFVGNSVMIILDTKTPVEVRLAQALYERKILPDVNQKFAKTAAKIFGKNLFKNTPFIWLVLVNAASRNHDTRTNTLRNALKFLGKIKGTIGYAVSDERTLAMLKMAMNHIEKSERILVEVLQEIEVDYHKNYPRYRKKVGMAAGKLICKLKRVVEMENKRRKSRKPQLPLYRNEWKLVVELLKWFWRSTDGMQFYTPSVDSVRQLAYRYKRRRKRKDISSEG
jgi:hypothetical protein